MLDEESAPADQTTDQGTDQTSEAPTRPPRRRAAGRPAGPPKAATGSDLFSAPAAKKAAPRKTAEKAPADKPEADSPPVDEPAAKKAAPARKRAPAKKKAASADETAPDGVPATAPTADDDATAQPVTRAKKSSAADASSLLFKAPEPVERPSRQETPSTANDEQSDGQKPDTQQPANRQSDDSDDDGDGDGPRRRKRSRGGRRRRKGAGDDGDNDSSSDSRGNGGSSASGSDDDDDDADGGSTRRRRRRVRQGDDSGGSGSDDPENTVVRVREGRSAENEITSVSGSTRLEAKKQRRREGREAGRRRAPIVSESEFLARREAVKREMVIRQTTEFSQIAVLEDDVLVEHYVSRESQTSLIGNVYLGRVQNVLPSMEAAFIDIGRGRNAVLYAGEVDWTTLGSGNGKQRKIEDALSSGQTILVQVTKDPIGQKGARLTSQISLAGRFLVYVPGGQTNGISRKLPDTERNRLKTLLKEVLPEEAGVIVRTAAEGASEDQLTRDVAALTARWDDIQRKVEAGKSPELLYGEPDLMIKVVRDLFNEDFTKLVVHGADAWDNIHGYVNHVAPDLVDRLERWEGDKDVFDVFRVDEQIAKALERKVWLPSGGSLVIDRTEAMTVVDVNTGKFTGSGGNLEETVTKNNLEAAEEVVRQLRLRDIGGIIVIDFIDMVLENNRDLVLRRLVECLGRDRTRHQVAEVTSLGLVQMTRKRIGTGLLESFGEDCDHCKGRGVVIHAEPVEANKVDDGNGRRNRRGGRGSSGKSGSDGSSGGNGNTQKSRGQNDEAKAAAPKPTEPPEKTDKPDADAPPEMLAVDAQPTAIDAEAHVEGDAEAPQAPVLTTEGEQP